MPLWAGEDEDGIRRGVEGHVLRHDPERDASFWHLQTNFGLVGKTTPGYMCRGPESYQVRSDLLK